MMQVRRFPLDLPRTPAIGHQDKLICVCAPLIAKANKYLAGWQALLLSPVGLIVLINVVLNSLPTYLMAALLLPKGVGHPVSHLPLDR